MKVLGITGGIATGKSVIVRELERRGYPVYEADGRAKFLMETDPILREELKSLLGVEAYTSEGKLNRRYLAERLFREPELRQKVNALVHPRTIADFLGWVEGRRAEGYPAAFKEAALTIEAGAWQGLDGLIVVYAPWPLRLHRLMQRDHLSSEAALARLQAQLPDWHKLHYADFVCLNTGQLTIPEIADALLSAFALPLSLQSA